MKSKHFTALMALFTLIFHPPLWAVSFCVNDEASLIIALNSASADADDDSIRIVTGSYSPMPEFDRQVRVNLMISGGWAAGCVAHTADNSVSTLVGFSGNIFKMTLDADYLALDRLAFTGWRSVQISEIASDSTVVAGEVSVSRCRFSNVNTGLIVVSTTHDIRIENSIFDGYQDSGLDIRKSKAAQTQLLLQFNTLIQPALGSAYGFVLQITPTATPFNPARLYNTVINGNNNDIRAIGQQIIAQ